MSYESALEAAGAKVLAFETFGDYQGTWVAKVEYNGEVGYVEGSYGSCSGCDAFEGEFGYCDPSPEALAAFGKAYLDGVFSAEQMKQAHNSEYDFGGEDAGIRAWIDAQEAA